MIVVEADVRVYDAQTGKRCASRSAASSLTRMNTFSSAELIRMTVDESEPISGASETSVVVCLPITSLGKRAPKLHKPIVVLVRSVDGASDGFVGSVVGTEIGTSGDTLSETVENLKDIIAAKYRLFSSLPFEKLGPIPRRQLSILRQHIHP